MASTCTTTPSQSWTCLLTSAARVYLRQMSESQVGPHRLRLQVGLQVGVTHVAAVAGLLVSPERCRRIRGAVHVDVDGSSLEHACQAVRPADVAGPDACCQTIGGVIGTAGNVFEFVEALHHHHRPEDLFAYRGHRVIHVGEHCRANVVALLVDAGWQGGPSRCDGCTLGNSAVDVTANGLELPRANDGADVGARAKSVADAHL